jgi:hypothetical protein
MQQKTSRPVQFEITESTGEAVAAWIKEAGLRSEDYLFPSRLHESLHLSTRQSAHNRGFGELVLSIRSNRPAGRDDRQDAE